MADPRKQLQWERDALAAGMDPAEVEKRRELQDRLYQAEETAIEVIDRQRRATTLLLEGMAPEDMNERVELDRYPPERLDEFATTFVGVSRTSGYELPAPKRPPPPPRREGASGSKWPAPVSAPSWPRLAL